MHHRKHCFTKLNSFVAQFSFNAFSFSGARDEHAYQVLGWVGALSLSVLKPDDEELVAL